MGCFGVVSDDTCVDFVECCGGFGDVHCEGGCVDGVTSLMKILLNEVIEIFLDLCLG